MSEKPVSPNSSNQKPLTFEAWRKFLDTRFIELMKTFKSDLVRVNGNDFIGPKDAEITINMNLFQNHFFLEMRAPFTFDYAKHSILYNEKLPADYTNKRFDKRTGKWFHTNEEKRYIMSSELVKMLWIAQRIKDETVKYYLKAINENKAFGIYLDGVYYYLVDDDSEFIKEFFKNVRNGNITTDNFTEKVKELKDEFMSDDEEENEVLSYAKEEE